MSGLTKLCKMYGSMRINGQRYVWDYAADEAVPESEMPFGSERHAKSERARWLKDPPRTALICAARGCDGCAICQEDKQCKA